MSIQPDESDLIGSWVFDGNRVTRDAVEQRIEKLIGSYLEEISISPESGAWEVLYRDPNDGRFWELTYPQSEMHGGGPKRLTNISDEMAASKYQDNSTGFLDLR
ncbi:MAG TPA: Imm27 family immunity protein [Rhizomicrobium sp.]|nr:Imm27 family immunity protein [Rhizomicrobium sp.]